MLHVSVKKRLQRGPNPTNKNWGPFTTHVFLLTLPEKHFKRNQSISHLFTHKTFHVLLNVQKTLWNFSKRFWEKRSHIGQQKTSYQTSWNWFKNLTMQNSEWVQSLTKDKLQVRHRRTNPQRIIRRLEWSTEHPICIVQPDGQLQQRESCYSPQWAAPFCRLTRKLVEGKWQTQ